MESLEGSIEAGGFQLRYRIEGGGTPTIVVGSARKAHVFERSGHTPCYEEPDLFDAELLNWMKKSWKNGGCERAMNRRAVVGGVALGTLAVARASSAQPARKVYRIGLLSSRDISGMVGPQPRNPFTSALLRGLRGLGYVYGEHFVTEPRAPEGKRERLPGLAAELVRLQGDVIVAGAPFLPALKRATSTIPIVMTGANDPVGEGFVQSLARPGGNFTGSAFRYRG